MTTKTSEQFAPVKIPERLFFRIGDVAKLAGLKPYVLRYWETEFPMIAPQKSLSGHRVYRRVDVETVLLIKQLLYSERYSIEGARKRIRELKNVGELKTYKQEKIVAPAPVESPDRKERLARMRSLARELRSLARTPMAELFG